MAKVRPQWEGKPKSGAPAKAAPAPEAWHRARLAFYMPGKAEPVTSLWADVRGGGGRVEVRLLLDYPDFAPEAGWTLKGRAGEYLVRSVSGRVLTCEPA